MAKRRSSRERVRARTKTGATKARDRSRLRPASRRTTTAKRTHQSPTSRFNAFVSYSHENKEAVHGWLVPALKKARLKILLDEERFQAGEYAISEMERAVRESTWVVLVCTRAYMKSRWTELENKIAFEKVLPVLLETCKRPAWLKARIHLDLRTPTLRDQNLPRLVRRLRQQPDVEDTREPRLFHNAIVQTLCRYLEERYQFLDFRGFGVTDRVPLRLRLAQIYVPLRARVQLPDGETWDRPLPVTDRALSEEEIRRLGSHRDATEVLDLLRNHRGVIVLGDPGSGKTTFLKFLALSLARRQYQDLGLPQLLPVVISLAALARRPDSSVVDFATDFYAERCESPEVGEIVRRAIDDGRALVLLDGLDEVREEGRRLDVMRRVEEFAALHRDDGNKLVVTSRIVGYRQVRPSIESVVECTLTDLREEDVERFIIQWTNALERAARGNTMLAKEEARRQCVTLLHAVKANSGVRTLASNPLLLTILALMQRQGVSLPERRVELYDTYVRTLVKTWNLARGLDQSTVTPERDVIDTIRVLAPLALWMHETSPGVGLVNRKAALRELEKIYERRGAGDPEKAANAFLDDVAQHTGLLLARGPSEYGFIHLTFQEYLAAVAIAQEGQRNLDRVVERIAAHLGDPAWREVSQLTVGYLGIIEGRDEAASEVVETLLERQPGEPGRAVVLAGEAVADASSSGVTPKSRERVVNAILVTLCDDARVAAVQRVAAGAVLGRLPDPRFRADCFNLPDDPLLGFLEVPAGPFRMGSDPSRDTEAFSFELPAHEVTLPTFYIARWPVTVAQFRSFLDAMGSEMGEADRSGQPPNHPVVYVSWHEARAYCGWLTAQLSRSAATPEPLRSLLCPRGVEKPWRVDLPTEAEWEKAARGTRGRIFPWGDEPDESRANGFHTKIGTTSPVGAFPSGRGQDTNGAGFVEEMAGNVWEWTRSLWGPDGAEAEFRYPYVATDGREDEAAPNEAGRVLRGGAFLSGSRRMRCACRVRNRPDVPLTYVGFRVVVAPGP